MNWLTKLVKERGGSTMRLIMVWTFFVCLSMWAFACYHYILANKGVMVDIPENIMKLLLGVSVSKVGQKYFETKAPAVPPVPPNTGP